MVETRTAPERAVEAQQLLAAIDRKIQATSRVLFNVRSMEFLNDMRGRLREERARVTPGQLEYLRKLRSRIR